MLPETKAQALNAIYNETPYGIVLQHLDALDAAGKIDAAQRP